LIRDSIILTPEKLHEVLDHFMGQDAFVFDVETMGDNRGVPTQNRVVWLSLATTGLAVAIPFGHPNGDVLISRATKKLNKLTRKFEPIPPIYDAPPEQMSPAEVFEILRPLFFSDKVKIAHNATFDLISIAKYYNEICPPPYGDTIVMQWLLDENMLSKKLKDLAIRYYGLDYDKEHVGKCIELWPFSKVGHYAYMDAKVEWLLYKKYLALIEKENLTSIFDLEMDVLGVLLDMGTIGAPVDETAMHKVIEEMDELLVEVEARIYTAAGRRFNINATRQKQEVLYLPKREGGQGLKPWKLTDTGKKHKKAGEKLTYIDYSTDGDSLERFTSNPVVEALLEYQDISKLKAYPQSYLGVPGDKTRPRLIHEDRIFAEFVQYGTTTGRFSCRSPNLQNIPRPDTDLGRKIRSLFVAPPGHKLIVADYGQIELVIFAHFADKGLLYKGFIEGVDPHTMTAAGVLNKDPDDISGDERQFYGKTMNFVITFGAGPDKVADMLKVSLPEAKALLAKHQTAFPEIYRLKDHIVSTCRSRRPAHVKTLLGRKRRLPTIHASDHGPRGYAERQAVSSVIQGSAADLNKLAMIRTNNTLEDEMSLILTVHDELVVIVPDDRVEEGQAIVREAMLGEGIQKLLRVPLKADIKVVDRWAEAK
jgi:DNA polymerase I-like protein with 3'-5' exonuclease and polymerase domains